MNKLTIFLISTIISSFALADFEIPNLFEDGQVTSASQMNENFQALKTAINTMNTPQPYVVSFKGYSDTIAGTAGVHSFALACAAVAAGSRICTGDELILSPSSNMPENNDGHAWIAKELTNGSITASYNYQTSGVTIHDKKWYGRLESCASGYGHTIINGQFSSDSCENSHPIACCK
jgi:hypothetical protein